MLSTLYPLYKDISLQLHTTWLGITANKKKSVPPPNAYIALLRRTPKSESFLREFLYAKRIDMIGWRAVRVSFLSQQLAILLTH